MSLIDTLKRTLFSTRLSSCYGLYALVLLFFLVSGCTSIKLVRLPSPDMIMSDSVKEVEAVLTGEDVVKSYRVRTKKIEKAEARAAKLEARLAVLEVELALLRPEYGKASKLKTAAEYKMKVLKKAKKDMKSGVEPEEPEFGRTLKIVAEEIKKTAKDIKVANRKFRKIKPRYTKVSIKFGRAVLKAQKARLKVKEVQSAAERKVAKRFAAKLEEVKIENILAESKKADIILLGEVHSNVKHHEFQLDVIKALVESGRKVAIGMEMFMVDSQDELNGWLDGDIGFEDFRVLYYANWKTPWAKYAPILLYAKEKSIDVVALSLERDAVKKVFPKPEPELEPVPRLKFDPESVDNVPEVKGSKPVENGVAVEEVSVEGIGPDGEITPEAQAEIDAEVEVEVKAALKLDEEEDDVEPSLIMTREELEAITCDAEPEYKSMLRDAIKEHVEDMNFDLIRFCRIQQAWDIAMAKSAKAYIEENPETTLVVIAGGMHAWKRAIPRQLTRLGSESIAELAEARIEAKKARAAAKEAKAAVKKAQEAVSSADIIAARARRVAREAAKAAGQEISESFMGLSAGAANGTYKAPTADEAADMEAATDAGASADVAKRTASDAADKLKELEDVSKEAGKIAKAATKRLKLLKRSKSDFNSFVVIPEMPQYEFFRSGSSSTDDGDYLLLY